MSDYSELVKALRCNALSKKCDSCKYGYHLCPDSECNDACNVEQVYADAAAAIEALQAEVKSYKALADEWQESAKNKERLLGLYRAEQAKHFYSATDDNGLIKVNPCACMNIPVFSDSSESPNS